MFVFQTAYLLKAQTVVDDMKGRKRLMGLPPGRGAQMLAMALPSQTPGGFSNEGRLHYI